MIGHVTQTIKEEVSGLLVSYHADYSPLKSMVSSML